MHTITCIHTLYFNYICNYKNNNKYKYIKTNLLICGKVTDHFTPIKTKNKIIDGNKKKCDKVKLAGCVCNASKGKMWERFSFFENQ